MFKNKMIILLVVGLQFSIIQSMDPNGSSGPMDDDLGLLNLFGQPVAAQVQPAALVDGHTYTQYPEYKNVIVDNRLNNAFAGAVQSPQKTASLKRLSDNISGKNQQTLQELGVLLNGGTPVRDQILPKINKIQPTPNGTLAAAAGLVAESMTDALIHTSSPSKKQKIMNTRDGVADKVPTPLLRKNAPIDVHHTQNGQLVSARSGTRMFNGGHNAQIAFAQGYLQQNQYVFTDRSHRNFGALIDGDCPKTLGYGFDDDTVKESVEQAVTIAKNPSKPDFRLSQVSGRGLVGSYQKGFAFATVFPVLWVNGNDLIDGNQHPVAKFCQINQSGKLQQTTDSRDIVKLSLVQLHAMMVKSNTKLKTGDPHFYIADITDEMQVHCAEQLARLGFNQFPSTVYGIKDDCP